MLTATVEAVEEGGYARLTVAQVIARARVSRKTFYDLFEDREDCFLAAFNQSVDQVSGLVTDAYGLESAWRDGVRGGLLALLQFMDEEPGLARICFVEALAAGPRVLRRRTQVLTQVKRVVDEGRNAPGARVARATQEAPDVTAEGVVGAVFAVLHTRLLARGSEPFTALLGPLMSMIVLPYLGSRVAAGELARKPPALPKRRRTQRRATKDPLEGLDMRLTYRTVRVLTFIAERPGASNREIAEGAGIADQGQISKLLTRLERLQLVRNMGEGQVKGAPNEWYLTDRGTGVERATRPR